MKLAFHQPNFLPNLGFFYKMKQADLFVVTTNLQFERGEGWQRRHKIKTPQGDLWLSVPVHGSQNQLIREVRIDNRVQWRRKQRRAIQMTYGKTPEKKLLTQLLQVYDTPWQRLVDINMRLLGLLKAALAIKTPVVLDEDVGGRKQHLIINICQKYKASHYLSGLGGKLYMTPAFMADLRTHHIKTTYINRDFTRPYPYSTLHYVLQEGRKTVQRWLQ